ncbi:MAG: SirB2 family protein [Burkholderiaceae bacterium]|nr:SirB2 family protein [Burkholderiaceae bacterium]
MTSNAYQWLHALHVGCVVLSLSGFAMRATMREFASPRLDARAWRILPHVIDTVLLASAVAMVWLAWWPLPAWILAKIVALVAYVGFGRIALSHSTRPRERRLALLAAVIAAAWIVSAALTKSACPPC